MAPGEIKKKKKKQVSGTKTRRRRRRFLIYSKEELESAASGSDCSEANWQKKTEGAGQEVCLTGSEVRVVNEKETVEEKTSLGVRNLLIII